MIRLTRCLSILVLTEDSGSQAHDTLITLAKKMLLLVDPGCQTQRIGFEPPDSPQARKAIRANLWKGDHQARVELVRYVATKLLQEDGFVLFHFDGDRTWQARGTSENVSKFDKLIRSGVRRLVEDRCRKMSSPRPTKDILSRLFEVTPFYSIEAWLYQNTRRAIALCQASCGGRHADMFASFEADRALLDEIEKPKEAICLGARSNHDLAGAGYPTQAVCDAGKSFAQTVGRLRSSKDLLERLSRTAIRSS